MKYEHQPTAIGAASSVEAMTPLSPIRSLSFAFDNHELVRERLAHLHARLVGERPTPINGSSASPAVPAFGGLFGEIGCMAHTMQERNNDMLEMLGDILRALPEG